MEEKFEEERTSFFIDTKINMHSNELYVCQSSRQNSKKSIE